MANFQEKFWGLEIETQGARVTMRGHIAQMTSEQAREVARGLIEAANAADENRRSS